MSTPAPANTPVPTSRPSTVDSAVNIVKNTIEDVSKMPKEMCTFNSVINLIVIVIFGYYLFAKMSKQSLDQNNSLTEGIILGIILTVFLWMAMSTYKKMK